MEKIVKFNLDTYLYGLEHAQWTTPGIRYMDLARHVGMNQPRDVIGNKGAVKQGVIIKRRGGDNGPSD